jgi:hypothetical protein
MTSPHDRLFDERVLVCTPTGRDAELACES